jgi:hypothetical protein
MEISDIASHKKVQNSTNSGKGNSDTFLGHTRANFGTLTREGHNNKQCPLH